MTIDELTSKVITATRNNEWAKEVIRIHVEQGVFMLLDAGVSEKVALSERSIGFLCSYLTDVDTVDAGNIKLSAFTKSRLAQLVLVGESDA